MMFFTSHLYTAMYVVELCYRQGISYIAWVHHIGAAIMAQTAIQLSRQARKYPDSAIELYLCLIWGKCRSKLLPTPPVSTESGPTFPPVMTDQSSRSL